MISMPLSECPLGTRFKYSPDEDIIFVYLDRRGSSGRGLIASWDGLRANKRQEFYAAAEEGMDVSSLVVYPVDN